MSITWYQPKVFVRDQLTFSILSYPSGNVFMSFSKRFCEMLGSEYVRIGIDDKDNAVVFQKSDKDDPLAFKLKKYRQTTAGLITDRTAINTLLERGFSGRYWVQFSEEGNLYKTGSRIEDE
jgi:hypothetical protein